MKKLSAEISRRGMKYFLVARTEKKAIYSQYYRYTLVGYEVFYIRIRATQKSGFFNSELGPREKFPTDENFGKTAWAEFTLEDAYEKYNQL